MKFTSTASLMNIKDAQNTDLDGDNDGKAGAYNFWFQTAAASSPIRNSRPISSTNRTRGRLPRRKSREPVHHDSRSLERANLAKLGGVQNVLVRILGNGGTTGVFDPPDALPYLIGTDLNTGNPLPDASFSMFHACHGHDRPDAVIKLREANLDVGSSTGLVSRAGAAVASWGHPAAASISPVSTTIRWV